MMPSWLARSVIGLVVLVPLINPLPAPRTAAAGQTAQPEPAAHVLPVLSPGVLAPGQPLGRRAHKPQAESRLAREQLPQAYCPETSEGRISTLSEPGPEAVAQVQAHIPISITESGFDPTAVTVTVGTTVV